MTEEGNLIDQLCDLLREVYLVSTYPYRIMVDEFQWWGPSKLRCFKDGSCHLTADNERDLHRFAKRLGLKRAWCHMPLSTRVGVIHYDLTAPKRAKALELGAVFVPARQQAKERMARRETDA